MVLGSEAPTSEAQLRRSLMHSSSADGEHHSLRRVSVASSTEIELGPSVGPSPTASLEWGDLGPFARAQLDADGSGHPRLLPTLQAVDENGSLHEGGNSGRRSAAVSPRPKPLGMLALVVGAGCWMFGCCTVHHCMWAMHAIGPSILNCQSVMLCAIQALIFFDVSGGPFGIEDAVGMGSPLLAILGFIILPLVSAGGCAVGCTVAACAGSSATSHQVSALCALCFLTPLLRRSGLCLRRSSLQNWPPPSPKIAALSPGSRQPSAHSGASRKAHWEGDGSC